MPEHSGDQYRSGPKLAAGHTTGKPRRRLRLDSHSGNPRPQRIMLEKRNWPWPGNFFINTLRSISGLCTTPLRGVGTGVSSAQEYYGLASLGLGSLGRIGLVHSVPGAHGELGAHASEASTTTS